MYLDKTINPHRVPLGYHEGNKYATTKSLLSSCKGVIIPDGVVVAIVTGEGSPLTT